jgi:hypothetical protein
VQANVNIKQGIEFLWTSIGSFSPNDFLEQTGVQVYDWSNINIKY